MRDRINLFIDIIMSSSLAMEDRNKLFKKVHGLLVKEGASHDEARRLVKEELRRGRGRGGGPGGQGGRTPDVVLIDDLCEG